MITLEAHLSGSIYNGNTTSKILLHSIIALERGWVYFTISMPLAELNKSITKTNSLVTSSLLPKS